MRPAIQFLILAALLLPGASLTAQEAGAGETQAGQRARPNFPQFKVDEVRMHYYRPRELSARTITPTVERIYGRNLMVADGQGAARHVNNIYQVGDAVVIYDTDEYAAMVLRGLEEMERSLTQDPGAPDGGTRLETLEFMPRVLSISDLSNALRPFTRQIQVDNEIIVNASFLHEAGKVVIRDTPAQLSEIREFLRRIDVPQPQVMITCHVIEGRNQPAATPLPQDLVSNLQSLLPYQGYEQLSVGILRTSAGAPSAVSLDMPGDSGTRFSLRLKPGAFDADRGTLTLEGCEFAVQLGGPQRQVFYTSTSVRTGEYSVLGVAGSSPLFVVLRVSQVR